MGGPDANSDAESGWIGMSAIQAQEWWTSKGRHDGTLQDLHVNRMNLSKPFCISKPFFKRGEFSIC